MPVTIMFAIVVALLCYANVDSSTETVSHGATAAQKTTGSWIFAKPALSYSKRS